MEGNRETGALNSTGIVGAGLAGTTLAIALRQAGLDVRLYDHTAVPGEGVPLTLTANGTRVLHALGLKEILKAQALFPEFSVIRSARTAFLLSQRPLGGFSEARYGAPDCVVMSGRLTAALREQAERLTIPMDLGAAVESAESGSGALHLADGSVRHHPALAVACGLPPDPERPGLTNLLNERRWQPAIGTRMVRAIGTRADPSRDHGRFLTTWVTDGLIALEQPLPAEPGTQRLALTLVVPDSPGADDPAAFMAERLGKAHAYLRDLFEDRVVNWVAHPQADCAEFWFAEKLAVLGGACHAHAPFPELSPSAALEDAWVLSRMMERWEDEPHRGFADYERFRKPRARRLRAFSEKERRQLMLSDPLKAWKRNLTWSLTSRFLPEINLQKTDWLYGYDCIKGFV